MHKLKVDCDICIVGGGLVGQTAALALAKAGNKVSLCAPAFKHEDRRTTALLMDSVNYLKKLGIWKFLAETAHPLKTMRIVDGTERLVRSQQTDFKSKEIGLEAFGYNVQNAQYLSILSQSLDIQENLQRVEGIVQSVSTDNGKTIVEVVGSAASSSIIADFVIGADGRNSLVRQAMNAGEREWQYPQTAIVLDFTHEYSSRFVSTEFHTESGPFTIVPRSDTIAGLVWMETPERAQQLVALEPDKLARLIEEKIQSFLGKVTVVSPVQAFPLKGMIANRFGEQNWALIGEAAHVFPPIGAQGFNLGIRDIQCLSDILGRYNSTDDRGGRYSRERMVDVNLRTLGVDVLNRTTISGLVPVNMLRSLGLHALENIAPLRKFVMKLGISPTFQGF